MSSSVVERPPSLLSAASPGAPSTRVFPSSGFPTLAKLGPLPEPAAAAVAAPRPARAREAEAAKVSGGVLEFLGEEVTAMSTEQLRDAVSAIGDFYKPDTVRFLLQRAKKLSLQTAESGAGQGPAAREAAPPPTAHPASRSGGAAEGFRQLTVTAADYIATNEEEMRDRILASDKTTQRNLEWAVGKLDDSERGGKPGGDGKTSVTNTTLLRMQSDRFDLDGSRVFTNAAGLRAAILADLRGNSLLAGADEQALSALAGRCVSRLATAGAIAVIEGAAPRELLNHQLEPASPGYSFAEVGEMFRSEVPTQRLLAFRVIAGVLANRDAVVAAEGYEYTRLALEGPLQRGVHAAYDDMAEELLRLLGAESGSGYGVRRRVRRVLTFALQHAVSADLPPELPVLLVWAFGFKSYSAPAVQLATLRTLRDFLRSEAEELVAERLWAGRLGLAELPRLSAAHSRRDESSYEEFLHYSEQKRRDFLGGGEAPEGQQEMPARERFSYGCRWGRVDSVLQESDVLPRLGQAVLGGARAGGEVPLLSALIAMETIALALRQGDGSTVALTRALVKGKLWALFIDGGAARAAAGTMRAVVDCWWRALTELARRDGVTLVWMLGQPAFAAALHAAVAAGGQWPLRLVRLCLSRGGSAGLGALAPLLLLLEGAPAAQLRPELLDGCEAAVDALGGRAVSGHAAAAQAIAEYGSEVARALAEVESPSALSLVAGVGLVASLLGAGDDLLARTQDLPQRAARALQRWWSACSQQGGRSDYEQGEVEAALLRLALSCELCGVLPLDKGLLVGECMAQLASAAAACNSVAEGLVAWRLSRLRSFSSLLRLHVLRRMLLAGALPPQDWLQSLLCCASRLGQGMLPSVYSVVAEIVACLHIQLGAAAQPPAELVLQLLDTGSLQLWEFTAHSLGDLASATLLLRTHRDDDGCFSSERYCRSLPLRRDWLYDALARLSGAPLRAWLRCLRCWEQQAPPGGAGVRLYCLLRLAKPSHAHRWLMSPESSSGPLDGMAEAFCSLALSVVAAIGGEGGWVLGAGACAEELAAACAGEAYSSARELSRGPAADGVGMLCEELLQSCARQEICPQVHSLVLALLVSPLVPLRVQRRTWSELGSARLLHLFEGDHFEGPLRLQPLFLLCGGANALQLPEARLVVRALSSLRAPADSSFEICGVATRGLACFAFGLLGGGDEADRRALLCELVEDDAVPAWVLSAVLAFPARYRRDLAGLVAAAAQLGGWLALASALDGGEVAGGSGEGGDKALLVEVWRLLQGGGASKLPVLARFAGVHICE